MRGIGAWAKDSRRPLPVGARPSAARFAGPACSRPECRPRSARSWRDGVPSSSMLIEPRRSGIVPSSRTVTPLAAICWPISPAKATDPLRLKSPSSPWPMASCSRIPGQPGPKHHVHHTGRGGYGLEVHQRDAQRLARLGLPVGRVEQARSRPRARRRPHVPLSRRPSCSTMTETLSRVMGRTSRTRCLRGAGSQPLACRRRWWPRPARPVCQGRGRIRRSRAGFRS